MIWDSMSNPRNYRVLLKARSMLERLHKLYFEGATGSRKRGESCVYCRRKKKRKWGGREVYRVGTVKGKDFVSSLEINQFEVFFCINVTQKNLHNFFQSNKSYLQLLAVLPILLSVLLGFLSLCALSVLTPQTTAMEDNSSGEIFCQVPLQHQRDYPHHSTTTSPWVLAQ